MLFTPQEGKRRFGRIKHVQSEPTSVNSVFGEVEEFNPFNPYSSSSDEKSQSPDTYRFKMATLTTKQLFPGDFVSFEASGSVPNVAESVELRFPGSSMEQRFSTGVSVMHLAERNVYTLSPISYQGRKVVPKFAPSAQINSHFKMGNLRNKRSFKQSWKHMWCSIRLNHFKKIFFLISKF